MRVFARYQSPAEHEELVEGLLLEQRLRTRLEVSCSTKADGSAFKAIQPSGRFLEDSSRVSLRAVVLPQRKDLLPDSSLFGECLFSSSVSATAASMRGLQELKEMREAGVRTFEDAEEYEAEKRKHNTDSGRTGDWPHRQSYQMEDSSLASAVSSSLVNSSALH